MFDAQRWAAVPFPFWSLVFFGFGAIVGSFLNVCIYRMPRGESIVSPPSHCPSCGKSIPAYLNIPLVSWLGLRGKCAFCGSKISGRYFLVELLTGVLFLCCWLAFGPQSALLALVYCMALSGLIVATFVDFEHFIIPDEITIGGTVAGFLCSFAVPELHRVTSSVEGLKRSFWGIALGGGLIYLFLRAGKALFGRQRFRFAPGSRVVFTETTLVMPDQRMPYEEVFYRRSDAVEFRATTIEMVDRCYRDVRVRLRQDTLQIGEDSFKTEDVPCLEATTEEITIPREAMGLGDVKFMAAVGAFYGWAGVLFALTASAILGSVVGVTLIACRRHAWSSRIPYGPYIAVATVVWTFASDIILKWWLGR